MINFKNLLRNIPLLFITASLFLTPEIQAQVHRTVKTREPDRTCGLKPSGQGTIRRDACGVEYCAPKGYLSFSEKHPEFARERGCKWKSISEHCYCFGSNGKPARIKRVSDLVHPKKAAL